MNKNMITRIWSGAILFSIVVVCLYLGGLATLLYLFAISEIGIFEFYRATGILKDKKIFSDISVIGYAMTALYYASLYFMENIELQFFIIIAFIIVVMGIYVFSFPKYEDITIAYSIMGFLYSTVMLSFAYRVRCLEFGYYTTWLIVISAVMCDTCAYFTGIALGKHKLAPKLSPKKSIEGSIGGIVGTAVLGFIYAKFVLEKLIPGCTFIVVIICVLGAVVSQIGDLVASGIKRNHNIKDYGKLIPGHGGVLDRHDSIIFVSPVIYFLLSLLLHGNFY